MFSSSLGWEQGRVEDLLDQDRVDDTQPGVDRDEQPDGGDGQLAGAEQAENPAGQAGAGAAVQPAMLVGLPRVRHGAVLSPGREEMSEGQRAGPAAADSRDSVGTMLPSLKTTPSSKRASIRPLSYCSR